jgi:hypothetical protein
MGVPDADPRRYEVSGETFHRCRVCGVLYDEEPRSVCATKLAEAREPDEGGT